MKENRLIFMAPGSGPSNRPLDLSENLTEYKIEAEDTIWKLTLSYYKITGDYERKICETIILDHNKGINPGRLYVGDTIFLPSNTYVAKYISIVKMTDFELNDFSGEIDLTSLDKENLTINYGLYSMSNQLMETCVEQGVGYCKDLDFHGRKNMRQILQNLIMDFNLKYNDDFEGLGSNVQNLPEGLAIYMPNVEYIQSYLDSYFEDKELESEANEAVSEKVSDALESIRDDLPLYINDTDSNLENEGNEFLENSSNYKLPTKPYHSKYRPDRIGTKFIILHSTISHDEHSTVGKKNASGRSGPKAHYVVKKNGEVIYIIDKDQMIDHAGRMQNASTKAMWNGERDVSNNSIGIEVVAFEKEKWNKKQYEAVKKLVEALGEEYGLQKKDVLAHSQVAASKWGRGRKSDPYGLDFSKLGLPNNYYLVDLDVVSGRINANLKSVNSDKNYTNESKSGLIESQKMSQNPKVVKLAKDIKNLEAESFRNAISSKYEIKKYTVNKGDGLIKIARKYGTTIELISKANGISENSSVRIGQTLYVPVKKS